VSFLLPISQLLIRYILSDDRYNVNRGVVVNFLIALLDRKINLPIKHFHIPKALTALLSKTTLSTTMWTLLSALIVFPTVEISYNQVLCQLNPFFRNKMTKLQRCLLPYKPMYCAIYWKRRNNAEWVGLFFGIALEQNTVCVLYGIWYADFYFVTRTRQFWMGIYPKTHHISCFAYTKTPTRPGVV